MQNEILKPVLATDETAIPRYDIVKPDGAVVQQNVELRLKNQVMQEGTPYDEESVLPATLRSKLGLPNSATPANAFEAILAKAGTKISMNEPTEQDNVASGYSIGALWLRIPFTLTNLSFSAEASEFTPSACTVDKAGHMFTLSGNGDDKIMSVEYALPSNDGWLYAKISIDDTAVNASITIGSVATLLTPGITNIICVPYTGSTAIISVTYTTANAESSDEISIDSLTVLDKNTVKQAGVDAGSDITTQAVQTYCNGSVPFNTIVIPIELWQQYSSGTWELIYGVSGALRAQMYLDVSATPDSMLSVFAKSRYMASYMAFIGASSEESVSAALGKNNDDVCWVGIALTKYEYFKNPSATPLVYLPAMRNMQDILGNIDALIEAYSYDNIYELLMANTFAKNLLDNGIDEYNFCVLTSALAGVPGYHSINSCAKLAKQLPYYSAGYNSAFSRVGTTLYSKYEGLIQTAFFAVNTPSQIFNTQELVDLCLDTTGLAKYINDNASLFVDAAKASVLKKDYSNSVSNTNVGMNFTACDVKCFVMYAGIGGSAASGQGCSADVTQGMFKSVLASSGNTISCSCSGLFPCNYLRMSAYAAGMRVNHSCSATYIRHS